jgi:hypothetical protein
MSWHDVCNAVDMDQEFVPLGPISARRKAVIMISRPEFAQMRRNTRSGIPSPCDTVEKPAFTWPANEIMLRSLLRTGHSFAKIGALHGVGDAQIAGLRMQYDI